MNTQARPIALITGMNRGLGRSMALKLAAAGSDVIGTYRGHREEADAVAAEITKLGRRVVVLQLDVGESASFAAFAGKVRSSLAQTWGRDRFDHLINNAGISLNAPIPTLTEDQFDELMRVHLKAPFFLTQALLPLIADGGRILNVSSGLTRFSAPGYAAYAAMKGGVEVFTRYLAQELGARRIAVNTIAPGAIATDFRDGALRDSPEANRRVAEMTALGRVGEADDIGGAVAALLADGSAWINGQRIEVSGGMVL
jgi:NAD(P)-dependent dehydrogenase (short-subunit alcohol dehydrogenase family)